MTRMIAPALASALLLATSVSAQAPPSAIDPFPPLPATRGVISVHAAEFATLPDTLGRPSRMMHLVTEPATRRLFVSDMNGPLYSLGYDGKGLATYLDLSAPKWGLAIRLDGPELGFQNFAFHPDFYRRGTKGYGRFYTYHDTIDTKPAPDFTPGGDTVDHDVVLLEWTAKNPAAAVYDGGPPREVIRIRKAFPNHNGGHLAFDPAARRGTPEYGLLYVGVTDGGGSGDPMKLAQRLDRIYGKILRIDPLGTDGMNGRYGVPRSNPFVGKDGARGEIWAYGFRNPQRFGWDPKTHLMLVADIGQSFIEKISIVPRGGNLGWSDWEGSFRFVSRTEIRLDNPRADAKVTYPLVEYDHKDPLLLALSAVTGVVPYRAGPVAQLKDKVLFGDISSAEMFAFAAEPWPTGGPSAIRRVMLDTPQGSRTLMAVMKEKAAATGKAPSTRADLRYGLGPNNEVYLLNRVDGVIRALRP